ncbi:MAG: hypothetical protein WA821_19410, partial [Anaerolineales bacterium]
MSTDFVADPRLVSGFPSTDFVADSRIRTDAVNGLCHGFTDQNGFLSTDFVADSRIRTDFC